MNNGEEGVCKSKEKGKMKFWDFTQRREVIKFYKQRSDIIACVHYKDYYRYNAEKQTGLKRETGSEDIAEYEKKYWRPQLK